MKSATTSAGLALGALAVTTGLLTLVFHDPAGRRAVLWSAGITVGVQVLSFCVARSLCTRWYCSNPSAYRPWPHC